MKGKNAGWQRVLLLIIPYIVVVGLFQLVGTLIAGVPVDVLEPNLSIREHTIIAFFSMVGTLLLVFIFVRFIEDKRLDVLGLNIKGRSRETLTGITLGAVIPVAGFSLLLFLSEIKIQWLDFSLRSLLISSVLFMIVSFTEEILFRAYILRNLMISFNKYLALVVSAVLFSLMHFFNPNFSWLAFINIFLAGLLLGVAYIHSRNLWFPLGLHFSWNFAQTLLGFHVSGHDTYSLIQLNFPECNVFNGGDFGFEGSLVCVVAQVLAIICVEIYFRKRRISGD